MSLHTSPLSHTFVTYVFPSLGAILASAMCAAPIRSLKKALLRGDLGDLDSTPWAFMTGNCLGWIAYSYITIDPFILAANTPGFLISIWLNSSASKLQYRSSVVDVSSNDTTTTTTTTTNDDGMVLVNVPTTENDAPFSKQQPYVTQQDRLFVGVLVAWLMILSVVAFVEGVGKGGDGDVDTLAKDVVGFCANVNLAVFYGAPLGMIKKVLGERKSGCIHRRTLAMTLCNSFFWTAYGLGLSDPNISIPNSIGLSLAVVQSILCLVFPRHGRGGMGEGREDIEVVAMVGGEEGEEDRAIV